MGVIRTIVALALLACSSNKPRAIEDARSVPRGDGAAVIASDAAVDAQPAKTGDLGVRVEWREVPATVRSSPGRTPCNTPRAPAVAPTTTWGLPEALVLVEGARPPGEVRIVLENCALAPRIAVATSLVIDSGVDRPAQVTLTRRGEVGTLTALTAGTPRTIRLPIAGHAVAVALEPGGIYELATDAKEPEVAWIVAAPGQVTDATGHTLVRDLPPGAHAVTAWIPPRAGQPARIARGTAKVTAGDLAELTLE